MLVLYLGMAMTVMDSSILKACHTVHMECTHSHRSVPLRSIHNHNQ